MYRLVITREEQPPEPVKPAEPGKRSRRRKPVTKTALQLELTDDEYQALRPALIEALK